MFEEWVKNRKRMTPILAGSEARFIRINKEVGIKIYHDKFTRDYARRQQKYFHKYGWAPAVHGSFSVPASLLQSIPRYHQEFDSTDKYYAYITEAARATLPSAEEVEEFSQMVLQRFPDVRDNDFHSGNFGRLKRKLVLIDFGPLTLEGYDGCGSSDSTFGY